MKAIVYYLRTEMPYTDKVTGLIKTVKVPKTTVTLLVEDGVYSRGVSMCSQLDIFSKEAGRRISYSRAIAGFETGKKIGEIKRKDVLIEDGINYKIEFQPELTEFEKRLFSGPKEV